MKLLLGRGSHRYLAGVTAGILLIAGCSSGRSLPTAVDGTGLAQSSHATVNMTLTGGATVENVQSNGCNSKKLEVCVKPGGKAILGIKLQCSTASGKTISCGKVHWSTKMSNSGLKGSFKPNPGNPTKETVTASKTIKVGRYHQTVTAKCSLSAGCVFVEKLKVTVT